MKTILKKFKWVFLSVLIVLLLVLTIIFKNNKIAELITKLRMGKVDSEEEKIDIAINDAIEKGKISKKKVDSMTMDQRADWYNKRYGK